jgi:uncharacterized membrane protein YoaK (UPF0700 family)
VTPARHLALGLILTATAGMTDVVGFMELGGYYTSFMSGNTTQIGAGLIHPLPILVLPGALVFLFFIGSFIGSYIAGLGERKGPAGVLTFTATTLLGSLALQMFGVPPQFALLPLALAAGAQNAIMPQRGAARLGTTFVSGTLYMAGQDLARAVRRQAPPRRWTQHLLVWLSLPLGGYFGALAYAYLRNAALVVPLSIYLLFLAAYLLFTDRRFLARI